MESLKSSVEIKLNWKREQFRLHKTCLFKMNFELKIFSFFILLIIFFYVSMATAIFYLSKHLRFCQTQLKKETIQTTKNLFVLNVFWIWKHITFTFFKQSSSSFLWQRPFSIFYKYLSFSSKKSQFLRICIYKSSK